MAKAAVKGAVSAKIGAGKTAKPVMTITLLWLPWVNGELSLNLGDGRDQAAAA